MENQSQALAYIFRAVGDALKENRDELNHCDPGDGKHGDQMVQVFELATTAISGLGSARLDEAMSAAAKCLEKATGSDICLTYAHGLEEIAEQLRQNEISFENLVHSVKSTLREDESHVHSDIDQEQTGKKGRVIKSLLAGLANWNQVENGQGRMERPLDFGELVGNGMAYMKAKQRNLARIDILADAAASASPLGNNQCTYRSGVIVMKALLHSIQQISV